MLIVIFLRTVSFVGATLNLGCLSSGSLGDKSLDALDLSVFPSSAM